MSIYLLILNYQLTYPKHLLPCLTMSTKRTGSIKTNNMCFRNQAATKAVRIYEIKLGKFGDEYALLFLSRGGETTQSL